MFYRQNNLQLLRDLMEQIRLLRDETGIVGYGKPEDKTTVVARITMRFPRGFIFPLEVQVLPQLLEPLLSHRSPAPLPMIEDEG